MASAHRRAHEVDPCVWEVIEIGRSRRRRLAVPFRWILGGPAVGLVLYHGSAHVHDDLIMTRMLLDSTFEPLSSLAVTDARCRYERRSARDVAEGMILD